MISEEKSHSIGLIVLFSFYTFKKKSEEWISSEFFNRETSTIGLLQKDHLIKYN